MASSFDPLGITSHRRRDFCLPITGVAAVVSRDESDRRSSRKLRLSAWYDFWQRDSLRKDLQYLAIDRKSENKQSLGHPEY